MDSKTGEMTWGEWLGANLFWWNPLDTTWALTGVSSADYLEAQQKYIINRETATINEKYWLSLINWLLQYTAVGFDEPNAWINDTKLHGFYIYSLIITLQKQCLFIDKELQSSSLIQRLKNTQANWKEEIQDLHNKNYDCYQRLLIYESVFKNIFNIKFNEKSFNILISKIPKTSDLSDTQINKLKLLKDCIFYGIYSSDFKGPFSVISCNENDSVCSNDIIAKFPYPPQEDDNKGFPVVSYPDGLVPIRLFNSISYEKGQAFALLKHSIGTLDWMFEKFTGIKAFWTHKTGQTAENFANTVAGAVSEINKKLKAAYNFGAGVVNSASQAGELITPVLILGGLALGLSLVNRVLGD